MLRTYSIQIAYLLTISWSNECAVVIFIGTIGLGYWQKDTKKRWRSALINMTRPDPFSIHHICAKTSLSHGGHSRGNLMDVSYKTHMSNQVDTPMFVIVQRCGTKHIPGYLLPPIYSLQVRSLFQHLHTVLYWIPLQNFEWNTQDSTLLRDHIWRPFHVSVLRMITSEIFSDQKFQNACDIQRIWLKFWKKKLVWHFSLNFQTIMFRIHAVFKVCE